MTVAALASLFGVWILAIMSPGPDIVMLTHQSSRGRGVPAALGVVVGSSVWIIASLLGLTWLITAYPHVYSWVVRLGGAFLALYGLYIVVMTLHAYAKSGNTPPPTPDDPTTIPSHSSRWGRGFTIGLLTNLSNPKALAFFTALFASMVPQPMTFLQAVILTIALLVVALIWFVSFALIIQSKRAQRVFARFHRPIDLILGSLLIIFGVIILAGLEL